MGTKLLSLSLLFIFSTQCVNKEYLLDSIFVAKMNADIKEHLANTLRQTDKELQRGLSFFSLATPQSQQEVIAYLAALKNVHTQITQKNKYLLRLNNPEEQKYILIVTDPSYVETETKLLENDWALLNDNLQRYLKAKIQMQIEVHPILKLTKEKYSQT